MDAPGLLEPALLRLLTVVLGDKESSVVTSAAFGVFARLLIHNAPAMLQFFQRAGTLMPAAAVHTPGSVSPGDPSEALLLAYLDLWYELILIGYRFTGTWQGVLGLGLCWES